MGDEKHSAGGRATEAGMSFQAAVAAWFAAHLLADVPIGIDFGLPNGLKITGLQCETGDALDDVVVRLDGGGTIYTQCKTRPSLTASADSLLAKTLKQLVDLYVQHGQAALVATPTAALLAVAKDAPRSIYTLEAACRMFDHGGTWNTVIDQVPASKRRALTLFETHVRTAWKTHSTVSPTGEDLVALARLLRIRPFAENAADTEWRSAAHLLGRRLFGGDHAGEAPMAALLGLCRKFIGTGAPIDRAGLLRALRAEGQVDVSAPAYDKDVATLLAYSTAERTRLRKHTRIPLGDGIPIVRDCLDPLAAATAGGSLLITGEPGAGKTGALLALAERVAEGAGPVVFLSVERFSGFTKRSDFRTEMGLEHDPIDILAAWPGRNPGVLIVDALDASRGGPTEPVIATFLSDAVERVGARWSVVASIRSFDLRNGHRFRQIMAGAPPNLGFVEEDMGSVRHFRVPRLSDGELADVSRASPTLSELEGTAPPKLRDLLRNVFNLSLAAELLDAGVAPQSIRTVATQSELIRRYEDIRLPSQSLQLAVKAAVTIMVQRRQLAVRAVDIDHHAVDAVRGAGVLVAAGDRVAFAHHVLFDHIAGRFYLAWHDTEALASQLSGDPTVGLVLGPALRFALEQVWQDDLADRTRTWKFLTTLASASDPDPVVVSIALRTAAERVEIPMDVSGLCSMLAGATDVRAVGKLVSQLARFVGMAIAERGGLSVPSALAWATVAYAAASNSDRYLADAARVLLMTLAEKADFDDVDVLSMFGRAARCLLQNAWSSNPENSFLATAAIRFVTKSYGSEPPASRALLERILEDRFDEHASEEAPELAEGVGYIIPYDASFVARIYATLFTRDVSDEGKTWIGGSASRILPLSSTRKQDYGHARWHLNQALKSFLDNDPRSGTAAVIGAVRGLDAEKQREHGDPREPTIVDLSGRLVEVVDDLLSLDDWREEDAHEEEPLTAFVDFLRTCPRDAFRSAVTMALELPTNAAVWARILGVAADRPNIADDQLWPLVRDPHFIVLQGLARDAIIYLAASYAAQPLECRTAFETSALTKTLFPKGRETRWWRSVLGRFLSSVEEELLATKAMRAVRAEMEAAGELTGNRPFMSITVGWGSDNENIVDSMLRAGGADLQRSPDREIRAASRKVEEDLKSASEEADAGRLAELWRDIVDLVRELDAGALSEPHEELVHASWGAVSNGVERIAKSLAQPTGADGLPDVDTLVALIDRLSASPYPKRTEGPSDLMSWGNWDVRVYAASSIVALAQRFAGERPGLVDRMQAHLHDPTPTVRLQVAQALNVLWNVAHARMWSLVNEVADQEKHEGVLRFFIAGPMWPLSRKFPERCAGILSGLLEQKWAKVVDGELNGRDEFVETSSNLVAFLYVSRNQPAAWAWIERWANDLRRGGEYLTQMLHHLRQVFFLPYGDAPNPEKIAVAERARRLLDLVVGAAASAIIEARPHLLIASDEATAAAWRPLYVTADRLIDQACSQLYFGSGAFRSPGDTDRGPGLSNPEAKQRFLAEFSPVLDLIAAHAQSRTVYNLFELLDYLAEGDPKGVFDRIAKILLGPASEDGYQFESLGANSLVKLVRRYLADHRDIFEDPDRRRKLVEVLELFSSAGWPDALKLLFELPDLLR